MRVLKMFRSSAQDNKQEAISHLKNLLAIAKADGIVAEIEQHLMISVASRLGISIEEFNKISGNLENIEFVLPEKYDDRVEQFQDILMLMSVDNHIDEEEMETCKKIAEKFELTERDFKQLVDNYLM
ncbi:MAG: TerB family tellurite resistance protein [Cyclobacteriaceae bacterium]|nr:TerB family tellurite resistance protein [Cyclobacteriaceae bacterium]